MEIKYRLPDDMRELFKKPIGKLICNPTRDDLYKIKPSVTTKNKLICVGDVVTLTFAKERIKVDVGIVDLSTKRKRIGHHMIGIIERGFWNRFNLKNEAGTITEGAIRAIRVSIESTLAPTMIHINGEEDLLLLPVIKYSPIGTVIIYGQPNEGIVVIRNDEKTVEMVNDILERMKVTE